MYKILHIPSAKYVYLAHEVAIFDNRDATEWFLNVMNFYTEGRDYCGVGLCEIEYRGKLVTNPINRHEFEIVEE